MTPLGAASSSVRWQALPPAWVIVLVILPLVVLTVRFFYRREAGRLGRRPRMAMGFLRILAILVVLAALGGPYTETVEGEYAKRHLVLAVDTSQSMRFQDGYRRSPDAAAAVRTAAGYADNSDLTRKSRLRIVADLLGRDPAYLERLAAAFHLHLYTFDADLAGLFVASDSEKPAEAAARFQRSLDRLEADGPVTRIGLAIQKLVRSFDARNEPVAGVLLFTDGRQTDGALDPVEEARRAAELSREGVAVYPVAIGDPASAMNIGVSRVDAPEVVLTGDEVAFTASVHARGLDGRSASLRAWVLDSEGKEIEELAIDAEPFDLPGDDDPPKKVTFRYRFDRDGTYDLKIGVDPVPGEAVESDNYVVHVLRVAKLKMRVLFVASKPNFTYRFLKEALFRAEQTIQANVLLLSAEPEWPQEASRGFDPIRVFPQTRAELAPYDVVVLADQNPRDPRFAPNGEADQEKVLANLEEWVKRGGGLVLQAGRDGNFQSGVYRGTPLMDLLPVVPLDHMGAASLDEIVQPALRKRYRLTPAGAQHPMMRILRSETDSRAFWDGEDYKTIYYWYAATERAKSSATVLAVRREDESAAYRARNQQPHPLIALQEYGLGKTLWLATDELWRMRDRVENLYYWRLWLGAIRHMATYRLLGGNKRIKIWVDRADGRYRVGDAVGIEAKFLDENFEPVTPDPADPESMSRRLRMRTPDGGEQEVVLYAVLSDPPEGLFRTRIAAGRSGTYRLIAQPHADEEPAETTFVVEETTREMLDPLMDIRTLRNIARESRTRVLGPDGFARLLDDRIIPPTQTMRSGEPRRTDLWDRAWVLWLFVGLLGAEWILRRLHLLL